jgi:hypothetical protein
MFCIIGSSVAVVNRRFGRGGAMRPENDPKNIGEVCICIHSSIERRSVDERVTYVHTKTSIRSSRPV